MQMTQCEHEVTEAVSETYLKGFSDFVLVECVTCSATYEQEVTA